MISSAEKNKTEKGTLYLVATPIGNLDDITLRALKVLRECDFIAAEDTRVTAKLLSHFEISKPVVIYQKYNVTKAGGEIADRLGQGETCALVTDAGTPGISDPGQEVARLCIEKNIPVRAVPGACAAICALISSGMPTDGFVFAGFPGSRPADIEKSLEPLINERRTSILYEAPHRLKKTLGIMCRLFGGDRKVALCRELTKLNEEVIRGTLSEVCLRYSAEEPRGEFVIILEGAEDTGDTFWEHMSVEEHVGYYAERLGLDRMSAVKAVARDRGVPKNEIYKELVR